MRYNIHAWDYDKYVDEINKEKEIQKELYMKQKELLNKIRTLKEDTLVQHFINLQENTVIQVYLSCNKEVKELDQKLSVCNKKIHANEQRICCHDFGVRWFNKYDGFEGKTYYNGCCLECGMEFNDLRDKEFTHEVLIDSKISGAMSVDEYKNKLVLLKEKFNYDEANNKSKLGEKIVRIMTNEAKVLNRKKKKI